MITQKSISCEGSCVQMVHENLGRDLEELIKEAQRQPGIADIMAFYAQYNEMLQRRDVYLAAMQPEAVNSYSANST